MSKFAVRVDRPRNGAGYALMFFNLSVGVTNAEGEFNGIFTVTDLSLMKSKDGEFYWRGPSKRRERNGEPVMKDGKAIYDELFRLYSEEGAGKDGGWGVTEAGHLGRKEVLKKAIAAYEALDKAPAKTTAPKAGKAQAATAARSTGSSASAGDFFDSEGADEGAEENDLF